MDETVVVQAQRTSADETGTVVAGYAEKDDVYERNGLEFVEARRVPKEDQEQVREMIEQFAPEPINFN